MKKKKLTPAQKKKIFAPLQRNEDRQRAFWFLMGAGTVSAIYLILNLL